MIEYMLPPDFAMGIASLSPVCGCNGRCAYCYIDIRGFKTAGINAYGIAESIANLKTNKDFCVGPEGTVFMLGAWGELFPSEKALRVVAMDWLKKLLPLGNPVVIVTKSELTEEEIITLKHLQLYDGQLLLLVSITTLHQWRRLEPGTCSPQRRLEGLHKWASHGLSSGVLLNPYIQGITNVEYEEILGNLININNMLGIVVSPLYLAEVLVEKIHERGLDSIIPSMGQGEIVTQRGNGYQIKANGLRSEREHLFEVAQQFKIPCWLHYLCLVSRCFSRKNKELFLNADYCISCGHCEGF